MDGQPVGLTFFGVLSFDNAQDVLSASASSATVPFDRSFDITQEPLRDRRGWAAGNPSTGSGTVNFWGKEKKLNKYLVVCGFWCTFAAKLRIECRKGFICAWLI